MSEKTNKKPVKCGCGGEAEVCKSPLKYGYCYFVKCERCETATNIFVKVEEAIEAWNKAMGATDMNVGNKIIYCKDCKYSHMTIDGLCKYCDIWFPNEKMYVDGKFFCASAEKRML